VSEFNLIDDLAPTVRFPDGRREELGVRAVLLRSKGIAAIEDPSPLVLAALYRFLLAVLYRALEGPTDISEAKEWFRDGMPLDRVEAYLTKWRERFWLFDEKYPFGQNPNVPNDEIEPWTKLTAERNATSNKVLFDHTDTRAPGERVPKECARWLVSTMTFSISGGRGYYPSPSPNAMMCIPQGDNLWKTLCYNLIPYRNRDVMLADGALWERESRALPLATPKRPPAGYADLFTWQARMVLLEQTPSGGVSAVRFVAGEGYEAASEMPDPMQPYRVDKIKGNLPLQFKAGRSAWRDFDSLLPDPSGLAPLTVQHALRLAGSAKGAMPEAVLVCGLNYDPPNANLNFWRLESYALPPALAGDRNVRSEMSGLLASAELAERSAWSACWSFARDLMIRGEREVTKGDMRNIKGIMQQMVVIRCFWSTLETHFHDLLHEFTAGRDSEDIECHWLKCVRSALKMAWERHRAAVSMGGAWSIRALVKAERIVNRCLMDLDEKITLLEPVEESV